MNVYDLTDQQLLEAAADAVGCGVLAWNDGLEPYSSGPGLILRDNRFWNPLVSRGDRYFLARELGLTLDFYMGYVRVQGRVLESFDIGNEAEEAYAVVRAAARFSTRRVVVSEEKEV